MCVRLQTDIVLRTGKEFYHFRICRICRVNKPIEFRLPIAALSGLIPALIDKLPKSFGKFRSQCFYSEHHINIHSLPKIQPGIRHQKIIRFLLFILFDRKLMLFPDFIQPHLDPLILV